MYLGCYYPDCGDGQVVGKKFCPKHLKTPFTTKKEVNAYRRGVRDGKAELTKELQVADLEEVRGVRVNTQGMGKEQISCLKALVEHGFWSKFCGWLWNTHSGTARYMESFVKRGLAVWDGKVYRPMEAARIFILKQNKAEETLAARRHRGPAI